MDEEYWDYLADELDFEESNALDLILNGLLKSNFFNTFEWTANCKQRIKSSETFPLVTSDDLLDNNITPSFVSELNDLNNFRPFGTEELQELEKKYSRVGIREEHQNESNYIIKHPVDTFMSELRYGCIPSPEILASVYRCFNLYYLANGSLSLEEVFFGKPVKRAGNYSKRRFAKDVYSNFHFSVIRSEHQDGFELKDFAIQYIKNAEEEPTLNYFHEENIQSFLKGYERWKKEQKNDFGERVNLDKRADIRSCLNSLGYSEVEVKGLLAEHYDSSLGVKDNLLKILNSTDK